MYEPRSIARLVPGANGGWEAFTISTILEELHGVPERIGALRDLAPHTSAVRLALFQIRKPLTLSYRRLGVSSAKPESTTRIAPPRSSSSELGRACALSSVPVVRSNLNNRRDSTLLLVSRPTASTSSASTDTRASETTGERGMRVCDSTIQSTTTTCPTSPYVQLFRTTRRAETDILALQFPASCVLSPSPCCRTDDRKQLASLHPRSQARRLARILRPLSRAERVDVDLCQVRNVRRRCERMDDRARARGRRKSRAEDS